MQLVHAKLVRGFSLVELMVTISILAILVSVGLPSFVNLMRTTALNSAANDLADTLRYTRSEAVQRNLAVGVVPTDEYKDGWRVCTESDCAGGEVLRVHQEALQSVTLVCAGIDCDDSLEFTGRGAGTAARFTITHSSDGGMQRCVRVVLSGNISVSDGACP